MELTDELVIKTLAEFEGRKIVMAPNGACFWALDDVEDGLDEDSEPVSYLTDYSAIAEVWRKVFDADRQDFYELIDDFSDERHWWGARPRDHAYVIARAIIEAKQKPAEPPEEEAGDFEGENY